MDRPTATQASKPHPDHESLWRRVFEVARRSCGRGDHQFGAFPDPDGRVLMEQFSGFTTEGHDISAYAERLFSARASRLCRRRSSPSH